MGIVDKLRGVFKERVLEEVAATYGLGLKLEAGEGGQAAQSWWEGMVGGTPARLELSEDKKYVHLEVGRMDEEPRMLLEPFEVKDYEAVTVDERLETALEEESELTLRFVLSAKPADGNYNVLAIPAIKDGAPKLSAALIYLELHRQGVCLGFKRELINRTDLELDFDLALKMARAMVGKK